MTKEEIISKALINHWNHEWVTLEDSLNEVYDAVTATLPKLSREDIRKHFNDFRYLASTDEPNICREFVRYEDVVKLVNEICG